MKICNESLFDRFIRASFAKKAELLADVKKCALAGNHNFSGILAWYYLNRRRVDPKALVLAEGWAKRSIDAGGLESHYHLAWARWFRNPADLRIRSSLRVAIRLKGKLMTDAMTDLGCAYFEGVGGTKSLRWAKYWYHRAAAEGNELVRKAVRKMNFENIEK